MRNGSLDVKIHNINTTKTQRKKNLFDERALVWDGFVSFFRSILMPDTAVAAAAADVRPQNKDYEVVHNNMLKCQYASHLYCFVHSSVEIMAVDKWKKRPLS